MRQPEGMSQLGDQIQFACDMSDLRVAGFIVLVASDGGIHTETRSRMLSNAQFEDVIRMWLDAEKRE